MANNYRMDYGVDLVFCIDATMSMQPLLDTVKNNALNFYGGQQWLPTCASLEYYGLICAPESYEGLEFWTEAYGDKAMKLPSAVALDSEDTTEFYSLASDVLTLFSESAIKVVTGQLDEAGYRQVIEDAKGMGLDRMTELYQAAYDDYLAG